MALDKSSLKARIIANLAALGFDTTANGRDAGNWMQEFVQAVSDGVVDEIQANARTAIDNEQIE